MIRQCLCPICSSVSRILLCTYFVRSKQGVLCYLSRGFRFWFFLAISLMTLNQEIANAQFIDVSSQVSILRSGLVFNRVTQTYDLAVTIVNTGSLPIHAPLLIVVSEGLPSGVDVKDADGYNSLGKPFIDVPFPGGVLNKGDRVEKIILRFMNPKRLPISPILRVEAGDGNGRLIGSDYRPIAEGAFNLRDIGLLDEEIEEISPGIFRVKTRFQILFKEDTTIAQANALLDRIHGRIVSMARNVPVIEVSVPDPGSYVALKSIIQSVGTEPTVLHATPIAQFSENALPQSVSYPFSEIHHHLAIRAAAAWNARSLIDYARQPTVIINDTFGFGLPHIPPFDVMSYVPLDFTLSPIPGLNTEHGYKVLSIIAASQFDSESSSGMFPGMLRLRVYDRYSRKFRPESGLRVFSDTLNALDIVKAELNSGRNVILNTSQGYDCESEEDANDYCRNNEFVIGQGKIWKELIDKSDLRDKFIHTAAGGNREASNEVFDARVNSPWNTARLVLPVGEQLNTVIVAESHIDSTDTPYAPVCRGYGASSGGNVGAIGDGVVVLKHDGTQVVEAGSSYAAPQVAGLAQLVWSIKPDLTAVAVTKIIEGTANTNRLQPTRPVAGVCAGPMIEPAPVIDAYAAVLATDEINTDPKKDRRVRRAILDVNKDGKFDITDLKTYLSELQSSAGKIDYSRYDLNGDGRTGGDTKDRFDLDNTLLLTMVMQSIEGNPVSFDENALTDQEIICYYAYSPLYSGDITARKSLLDPVCRVANTGSEFPVPDATNSWLQQRRIAAGNMSTCIIRADSTASCWGYDYDSPQPEGTFVAISGNGWANRYCGIRENSTVTCWGYVNYGTPGSSFVSISVGYNHVCGIRTDGRIVCWGANHHGQSYPPDGTFVDAGVGYGNGESTSAFASVSAGGWHTCGIRTDGTVNCWGDNSYGQTSVPGGTFLSISTGFAYTCGIRTDGTVNCWGGNAFGETNVPSGKFVSVSAGGWHTCGIRTDGTVSCWGDNSYSQTSVPGGKFISVSAGRNHTCGIRTDGTVSCWGDNSYGQSTPPSAHR